MNSSLWLSPLILLPGVALLILSTSGRYGQIHSEIHHLLEEKNKDALKIIEHLLIRSKIFRNALVSLYISVGFLALAGLVGCLAFIWDAAMESVIFFLIGFGVAALLFAAIELIRESILSLEIIKIHHKNFKEETGN